MLSYEILHVVADKHNVVTDANTSEGITFTPEIPPKSDAYHLKIGDIRTVSVAIPFR